MRGPSPQANHTPASHSPLPIWQQLPQLDQTTVDSLRGVLPASALLAIYTGFVHQTSERLTALEQGAQGPGELASAAHAIAGSAGMLGAARLEGACRAARAEASTGAPVGPLVVQLSGVFAALCDILRSEGLTE